MKTPAHRAPRPARPGDGRLAASGGFSLVEAVVAIFILTTLALAMGQVVGMGMASNASSDEITQATTLAASKLEELRSGDYESLAEGGSLDENDAGYFDTQDMDGDGLDDYTRRWRVTDLNGGKLLEVVTSAASRGLGPDKSATMATIVSDPDDDVVVP